MSWRIFFVLGVVILFPWQSLAYTPIFVEQKNVMQENAIIEVDASRWFFGELEGFPHTFVVTYTEPTVLNVHILLPDIPSTKNNVSGLIVREPEQRGRVELIARMQSASAGWELYDEWTGGDTYRMGPSFSKELPPGTYRVEVSTPNNVEQYVLVYGDMYANDMQGYITRLKNIARVKVFFGKSSWAIAESPYVYIPVVLCLLASVLLVVMRRRKRFHSSVL